MIRFVREPLGAERRCVNETGSLGNSSLTKVACHYVRYDVRLVMNILNASEARAKLYRLLDETSTAHEPVLISGPRSNAVLIGEEDWNAIQETLYLLSIPGMRESIRRGLKTPIEKCKAEPGW